MNVTSSSIVLFAFGDAPRVLFYFFGQLLIWYVEWIILKISLI